ncbi:MAG: HAD family phosphatase [Clostridiaceae bacterium]|jgi:HAD superfamily hydrolase (TIGR01509 family)|nr:HAD family phosphatase [Clostridiaceae bacterium]
MTVENLRTKGHYEGRRTCRSWQQKQKHKYLLFDMDGTLLDSMFLWHMLIEDYLDTHGYLVTEEMRRDMSYMRVGEVAQQLHETCLPEQTTDEIIHSIYAFMKQRYEDVTVKTGVVEFLQQCRDEGKVMAVVTATARELALPVLKRLELDQYFDLFLSTKDIGIDKLQPDIYVQAARELGAKSNHEAAVFEDAPYALKTAAEAGFYTILLDDPVFREEQADYIHLADEYYMSMEELLDRE